MIATVGADYEGRAKAGKGGRVVEQRVGAVATSGLPTGTD
jgi:hypothetical protein